MRTVKIELEKEAANERHYSSRNKSVVINAYAYGVEIPGHVAAQLQTLAQEVLDGKTVEMPKTAPEVDLKIRSILSLVREAQSDDVVNARARAWLADIAGMLESMS